MWLGGATGHGFERDFEPVGFDDCEHVVHVLWVAEKLLNAVDGEVVQEHIGDGVGTSTVASLGPREDTFPEHVPYLPRGLVVLRGEGIRVLGDWNVVLAGLVARSFFESLM